MSSGQLLVIAAVVLFASVVQSLSGFGFALMAVPLMSLAVEPRDAVVVCTFLGTVTSAAQAWQGREHVDRALSKRLIVASLVGMPFGLMVLLLGSTHVLRLVLGIVVLIATYALARGVVVREGASVDWLLGGVSGILSTSLSTNGPPLVFLMQSRKLQPDVFRSTINTVFIVGNIVSLILFAASGLITLTRLGAVAVAVPSTLVGLVFGIALRRFVHGERFRSLVLLLLMLSGISAVIAALR